MKNLLFLIPIIFLISCAKDDVNPSIKNIGFLDDYLKKNPDITILKTTESNIVYTGGVATYRGYIFKPLEDLKLNAIGGRIAKQGIYKFEILKLDGGWYSTCDTLFMDSINITNISSFQYKNVDKDIILFGNERYIFRYFNENHNSVYDAGLGFSQSDTINYIKFPLAIEDVEIEIPYYTYQKLYDGEYRMYQGGTFNLGILRGLIDFKYEIAE
jgi:hypothetical protein